MIQDTLKTDWISATLIFLIFATAFSVQGSITILYATLLLLALYNFQSLKEAFYNLRRDEIILIASFLGWLIATIISSTANNHWMGSAFENPIRLALASILYLYFKTINKKTLEFSLYGFIAAPLMLIATHKVIPIFNRWDNYLDAVFFGAAAVISASASILILLTHNKKTHIKVISLIALAAALIATFKSGTRGAWIAVPVIFLPYYLNAKSAKDLKRKLIIGGTAAAIACIALYNSHQFDQRMHDIKSNLISWQKGNDNTPLGIRLTIWKIALGMYKENPLFGKGPGTFTQTVIDSYQDGHISKMVVDLGAVQPHNEYLAAASQLGSIGLIADLAIFLIPIILFIKILKENKPSPHSAFGLTIALLFMIFGVGIEILLRVTFSSIYGLLIALIYVIASEPPFRQHNYNTVK